MKNQNANSSTREGFNMFTYFIRNNEKYKEYVLYRRIRIIDDHHGFIPFIGYRYRNSAPTERKVHSILIGSKLTISYVKNDPYIHEPRCWTRECMGRTMVTRYFRPCKNRVIEIDREVSK